MTSSKYTTRALISAFFIVFLGSFPAFAATYYVKNGGSDAAAGTSDGTAWSDISVSVGKLNSGDTLLLKRGSTFVETDIVTVSDTNVTIGCYGEGARPIWSGNDWEEPGNWIEGQEFSAQVQFGTAEGSSIANGGRIECIRFLRPGGMHIKVYSDNVTVHDTVMEESFTQSVVAYNGADGTTITNNTVLDGVYGYENRATFKDMSDPNCIANNENCTTYSPCTGCWGASISNKGSNTLIQGNTVTSFGESINNNCGAYDFVIRDNKVYGGMVGIYMDVVRSGLVENNIIMRASDKSRYVSGIGFNVEPNCHRKSQSAGLTTTVQNIVVRNNRVSGFKQGLWLADELGRNDTLYPNYTHTVYTGNHIYHNDFIDNEKQINMFGGDWSGSWIKNNVFHTFTNPTSLGMLNGAGTVVAFPAIAYNYFTLAPTGTAGATNSVTSGINIVRETGWRTTAMGGIVASDFDHESGSATLNAGVTPLGNSQVYTSDYYGNSVTGTPNIGSFEAVGGTGGGGGGGGSVAGITSVNTNNVIQPNQSNSAVTVALAGAYTTGSTVSDGVDSEAITNVIANQAGSALIFNTGPMTNIGSPVTLTVKHATPAIYDTAITAWSTQGISTISDYPGESWIYDCARIGNLNAGIGNSAESAVTVSAVIGDIFHVRYIHKAGDSGKYRLAVDAPDTGVVNYRCSAGYGSCNNLASSVSDGGTSVSTLTETAIGVDSLYSGAFNFTADVDGTYKFELGPETTNAGQDVVGCALQVWKNRGSGTDTTKTLTLPVTASITNVNGDDVLTAISAANGLGLYPLSSNIAGSDIAFATPNAGGTVATFKIPEGLATGSQLLTLNVAQPVDIDQTPSAWPTNSSTVTASTYTGTHLGYAGGTKLTVGAGGADWAGWRMDSVFSVAAGDEIEQWFDVVQSTGGRARATITNETITGYLNYRGVIGGLTSEGSTACDQLLPITTSEQTVEGMTRIKLKCTSKDAGTYRVSLTPDSAVEGDALIALGRATFVNAVPVAVTRTVSKPSDFVPEPETVKRIKFADDYDGFNDSRIYNPGGGLRSTAIDVIAIYTAAPMYVESTAIAPIAGYAINKTPVAGVLTLQESDLVAGGSINALTTGQVVWIDAWNNDGSFKMTRKLKIVAEAAE